jgi:hypothetical protein
MPSQWFRFNLLIPSLVLSLLSATGAVYSSPAVLLDRDGHGHHHHTPLLELNETEILMYHAPTPPSYWSIDFQSLDPSVSSHATLMIFHAALMSLAFFVALPIGKQYHFIFTPAISILSVTAIAMRSVGHSWRALVLVIFYCLSVLGWGAAALYTKLTPNM